MNNLNQQIEQFLLAYFGDTSVEEGIQDFVSTFERDTDELLRVHNMLTAARDRLTDANQRLLEVLRNAAFSDLTGFEMAIVRIEYLLSRLESVARTV
jgi:hypothetical protein